MCPVKIVLFKKVSIWRLLCCLLKTFIWQSVIFWPAEKISFNRKVAKWQIKIDFENGRLFVNIPFWLDKSAKSLFNITSDHPSFAFQKRQRFVKKKVGLMISTKSNLAKCNMLWCYPVIYLIIFLNMLPCHLSTKISPPVRLPLLLSLALSRLKHPIPVNDRPIIYLPFSSNVFSLKRLFKLNLQECYRFTSKYFTVLLFVSI